MKKILQQLICISLLIFPIYGQTIDLFIEDTNSSTTMDKYNPTIENYLEIGTKLRLLHDTEEFIFSITSIDRQSKNRYIYYASSGKNTLKISRYNTSLQGILKVNNKTFHLNVSQTGEVNFEKNDEDNTSQYGKDFIIDEKMHDSMMSAFKSMSIKSEDDNKEYTYTILVAYTDELISKYNNNIDDINNYIATLISDTNQGYQNSNVKLKAKLVYSYYLEGHTQKPSIYKELSYFGTSNDDIVTELRNIRDEYSADIVIILGPKYSGICGVANLDAVAENAVAIVGSSTTCTNRYTFGHEIGHLFGLSHNYENASINAPYNFGYGYCHNGEWQTIMSYNCAEWVHISSRLNFYSNPNINYEGHSMGSDSLEFNAKVLKIRAPIVSQFRNETTYEVTIPKNFTYTALGSSQVSLAWDYNSTTIDYFKLYKDSQLIATLEKDKRIYTVENLSPLQNYVFSLVAENDGNQSNTAYLKIKTKIANNAPATPSNFKFEFLDDDEKIRLTWQDNSDNETHFELYDRGNLIQTIDKNIESIDFKTKGILGEGHLFFLKAVNTNGSSDKVGLNFSLDSLLQEVRVKNPTVEPINETTAKVTWEARYTKGVLASQVNYHYSVMVDDKVACWYQKETTCILNNLEKNKEYEIKIAVHYKTSSGGSGMASYYSLNYLNGKISIITSPSNNEPVYDDETLILKWQNHGAAKLRVYITAIVNGKYQTIKSTYVGGNTTSLDFKLPSGFTAAYVYLHSYVRNNQTSYLNYEGMSQITLYPKISSLESPTNLKAINVTARTATLTWNDNSTNEQGFKLSKGWHDNSTNEQTFVYSTWGFSANTTTHTFIGLTPNTKYTVHIRAYNEQGVSKADTIIFKTNSKKQHGNSSLTNI